MQDQGALDLEFPPVVQLRGAQRRRSSLVNLVFILTSARGVAMKPHITARSAFLFGLLGRLGMIASFSPLPSLPSSLEI